MDSVRTGHHPTNIMRHAHAYVSAKGTLLVLYLIVLADIKTTVNDIVELFQMAVYCRAVYLKGIRQSVMSHSYSTSVLVLDHCAQDVPSG
jgi:hypothetical protein